MKKKWLTLSAIALCLSAGSALAKDIKEIRFGVDTTYPPFEYKAPDGSFAGFDVELGNAICEKLAVKCRWIVSDFDGTLADSFPWFVGSINECADRFGFRRMEAHAVDTLRGYEARAGGP